MRFPTTSVLALAVCATASTPPGTTPASAEDLIVAFGSTLATQGVDLVRNVTLTAPSLGTSSRLFGTYTLMMVDYDIPTTPGSKLLHWMQPGLVSASTTTVIAGKTVFQLTNTSAAFASYNPPNPPNRAPVTHRYVQMLLNTTGNADALATIAQIAMNRSQFDPDSVVSKAGVTVVAGNWFNVTNADAKAAAGNGTSSGTITSATSSGVTGTSTGRPVATANAAVNIAGSSGSALGLLGVLAVAAGFL